MSGSDTAILLNFDGTEGGNVGFGSLSIGQAFRRILPAGYYLKINAAQAKLYGSEKPTPIKSTRLPDVILEEGTVPDDGVHSDQFWYVKVKKAFPTMRIMRDGQWAEVETGFVLKDGVWKPIEEIYKLQDGQWVQA